MEYFRDKYVRYAQSCGISNSKLEKDKNILLAFEKFYPNDICPERYLEILKAESHKFESLFFYHFLTKEIDHLFRLDNFLCTNVWIEVSNAERRSQVAQHFKSLYLQRQLDFTHILYGQFRLTKEMYTNLAANRDNILLEVPKEELWDEDLAFVIQTILKQANLLLILQMVDKETEIIDNYNEFEFAAYIDGTIQLQTNPNHRKYVEKYGKTQQPMFSSENISSTKLK